MNGLSAIARSLVQREAVNTWSYVTTSVPWSDLYRYFRLSSSFCDDEAVGWVEMTGDGYASVGGDKEWFTGWNTDETLTPDYNTGGYLSYDVVFPLNTGTSEWPTLRQIGVFGTATVTGTNFIYGVQPDPTFNIGEGQRLVLLAGTNQAATVHTAGLIASNGIPVP